MPPEILIRGAGPVGCTLALLLRRAGMPVALLDQRRDAVASSVRPIALSHASRLILERAGAWEGLPVTPIDTIHVSQQGGFGRTRICAADVGLPALGYVVDYGPLLESLRERVSRAEIKRQAVAHDASLVVHAEGSSEESGEKRYPQDAIVALVATDPPSRGTAWERFTPEGPLALLPLGGRYGLVWGMRPERADALWDAPERAFLDALALAMGRRAGAFVSVTGRARTPLALRVRAARVGERCAYVGNAAQTLHPVAGQGLNLGLRDVWDLAQVLHDADDPGAERVLRRYAGMRRLDAGATVRTTDFLAGAFLGNDPVARAMRGIGLTALDICLPARRFFARRMIFGASALP
jgi:2-octaprenyl-6-methoxyphenol hydroxylase